MTVLFTDGHAPYLSPTYRAAYLRAMLKRRDTSALQATVRAAQSGDRDAAETLRLLRAGGSVAVGKDDDEGSADDPGKILGRASGDTLKHLIALHYKATALNDPAARDEYNSYVTRSRQGDVGWLLNLMEFAAIKDVIGHHP